MHGDAKGNGVIQGVSNYFSTYGVSGGTGKALQNLGIIESTEHKGVYVWKNGEPDEAMASRVVAESNRMTTASAKAKSKKPVAKGPHGNLFSFNEMWEKFNAGIELAKKYGIPEENWKEFVKDTYFKKM
jgi:hypothetical protein